MTRLPHVTALITAYNRERFIGAAVDSALAQDYEGELDVVVIDDGSTDGTADELRARPQVRVVHQENRGYVGASNRAFAEGTGELFALLDADDAWPREKIRLQVEALGDAGLLYGDMTVIDGDGAVIDPSWLDDAEPPQDLAGWLGGNVATSSSILVRAHLVRAWTPLPPGIAFADWYLAVRAAIESRVVYLPEPRTFYRYHGENMGLGSSGRKRADELRRALFFQRHFLRRITPEQARWEAYQAFEAFARELQEVAETPFTPLVEITDADREEARAAHPRDLAGAIRALAADPSDDHARAVALDFVK
jgi:glycosyltransferase involved in cell wall biosynthesis